MLEPWVGTRERLSTFSDSEESSSSPHSTKRSEKLGHRAAALRANLGVGGGWGAGGVLGEVDVSVGKGLSLWWPVVLTTCWGLRADDNMSSQHLRRQIHPKGT